MSEPVSKGAPGVESLRGLEVPRYEMLSNGVLYLGETYDGLADTVPSEEDGDITYWAIENDEYVIGTPEEPRYRVRVFRDIKREYRGGTDGSDIDISSLNVSIDEPPFDRHGNGVSIFGPYTEQVASALLGRAFLGTESTPIRKIPAGKLETLLEEVQTRRHELREITTLYASAGDEENLRDLVSKCKVALGSERVSPELLLQGDNESLENFGRRVASIYTHRLMRNFLREKFAEN